MEQEKRNDARQEGTDNSGKGYVAPDNRAEGSPNRSNAGSITPVHEDQGNRAGNSGDFSNNNTVNDYAHQVDVNTGGVSIEESPGATNRPNNPSNPDLATAPGGQTDNQQAMAKAVDQNAEKETGRPTGAIYGSGGELISVQNPRPAGSDDNADGADEQQS